MEKRDVLPVIYRNIKAVLDWKEMTEPELCERIGVGRGYFDRNRDDIGVTRLLQIAETLEIRPEELWNEEFITEVRKNALKGKIERLSEELKELEIEGFMEKPIPADDTIPEKVIPPAGKR